MRQIIFSLQFSYQYCWCYCLAYEQPKPYTSKQSLFSTPLPNQLLLTHCAFLAVHTLCFIQHFVACAYLLLSRNICILFCYNYLLARYTLQLFRAFNLKFQFQPAATYTKLLGATLCQHFQKYGKCISNQFIPQIY